MGPFRGGTFRNGISQIHTFIVARVPFRMERFGTGSSELLGFGAFHVCHDTIIFAFSVLFFYIRDATVLPFQFASLLPRLEFCSAVNFIFVRYCRYN